MKSILLGDKYRLECPLCHEFVAQDQFRWRIRKKTEMPEGRCEQCAQIEYATRYKKKHPERYREAHKTYKSKWQKNNKDKVNAAQRRRYRMKKLLTTA